MTSISDYSVTAVKKIRGHDGYGYTCNLMRNKKKIAEILEDGWGGPLQFKWLDHNTNAVVNTLTYDDKPHCFNGTVEESMFNAEVMRLPKIPTFDGMSEMSTTPDIVIDEMVNDVLIEKQIKSDLKKNVTIKCKDGQLLSWKISEVHSEEVLKNYVIKKYPDAIILNNLPLPELTLLYKQSQA